MFTGAQGKGHRCGGRWPEGTLDSFHWVTPVCCSCTRALVPWVRGVRPVAQPCRRGEVSPGSDCSHSVTGSWQRLPALPCVVFNLWFLAEATACTLLWLLLPDFSLLQLVPWCFQVRFPLLLGKRCTGKEEVANC